MNAPYEKRFRLVQGVLTGIGVEAAEDGKCVFAKCSGHNGG